MLKPRKNSVFRRFFSGVFCLIFFSTNVSSQGQASQINLPEKGFALSSKNIDSVSLPKYLGSVENKKRGEPEFPLIFIIQDAHALKDAQTHIRKIIDYLQQNYGVQDVFVEGAAGPLDTQLIRAFPDFKRKEVVLNNYLEKGEITGAQLAALMSTSYIQLYGLEDWSRYQANYLSYLKAGENRDRILDKYLSIKAKLNQEKQRYYSRPLNNLHSLLESFYGEEINLINFLTEMKKQSFVSESHLEKYPNVKLLLDALSEMDSRQKDSLHLQIKKTAQAFRKNQASKISKESQIQFEENFQSLLTGAMSDQEFLKKFVGIAENHRLHLELNLEMQALVGEFDHIANLQGTKLYAEFESLIQEVRNTWAKTEKEKILEEHFTYLRLIKKLAKLELTQEEFQRFLNLSEKISPEYKVGPVLISPGLEFYRLAKERDEILVKNLTDYLAKGKPKSVAVVAGGFHAKGLEEKIKSWGASFVTISPKIHSMDGYQHYAEVMSGRISYQQRLSQSFYDAFHRDFCEAVFAKFNEPDFKKNLKLWRDQVIRNLSDENRLSRAWEYTKFVDALAFPYFEKFKAGSDLRMQSGVQKRVSKELDQFRRQTIRDFSLKQTQTALVQAAPGMAFMRRLKISDLDPEISRLFVREPRAELRISPMGGARQRQELLFSAIRKEIESAGGKISFEKFMDMSLYHPDLGFYTRNIQLNGGAISDFITSVERNPEEFTRGMIRWYSQLWELMGKPARFQIVEMGGGSGTLAARTLYWLKNGDSLLAREIKSGRLRIDYVLVERSDRLTQDQQSLLQNTFQVRSIEELKRQIGITWVKANAIHLADEGDSSPSLRMDIPRIFVSNELPDTFPIHRVRMNPRTGQLEEVFVEWNGSQLVEKFYPLTDPEVRRYITQSNDAFREALESGGEVPINTHTNTWLGSISKLLKKGFVITLDYGLGADIWPYERKSFRTYGIERPFNIAGIKWLQIKNPRFLNLIKGIHFAASRHPMIGFQKFWDSLFVEDHQTIYGEGLGLTDITSSILFPALIREGESHGLLPYWMDAQNEFFPDSPELADQRLIALIQRKGIAGEFVLHRQLVQGRSELRSTTESLSPEISQRNFTQFFEDSSESILDFVAGVRDIAQIQYYRVEEPLRPYYEMNNRKVYRHEIVLRGNRKYVFYLKTYEFDPENAETKAWRSQNLQQEFDRQYISYQAEVGTEPRIIDIRGRRFLLQRQMEGKSLLEMGISNISFRQLMEFAFALGRLHGRGIAHRDLVFTRNEDSAEENDEIKWHHIYFSSRNGRSKASFIDYHFSTENDRRDIEHEYDKVFEYFATASGLFYQMSEALLEEINLYKWRALFLLPKFIWNLLRLLFWRNSLGKEFEANYQRGKELSAGDRSELRSVQPAGDGGLRVNRIFALRFNPNNGNRESSLSDKQTRPGLGQDELTISAEGWIASRIGDIAQKHDLVIDQQSGMILKPNLSIPDRSGTQTYSWIVVHSQLAADPIAAMAFEKMLNPGGVMVFAFEPGEEPAISSPEITDEKEQLETRVERFIPGKLDDKDIAYVAVTKRSELRKENSYAIPYPLLNPLAQKYEMNGNGKKTNKNDYYSGRLSRAQKKQFEMHFMSDLSANIDRFIREANPKLFFAENTAEGIFSEGGPLAESGYFESSQFKDLVGSYVRSPSLARPNELGPVQTGRARALVRDMVQKIGEKYLDGKYPIQEVLGSDAYARGIIPHFWQRWFLKIDRFLVDLFVNKIFIRALNKVMSVLSLFLLFNVMNRYASHPEIVHTIREMVRVPIIKGIEIDVLELLVGAVIVYGLVHFRMSIISDYFKRVEQRYYGEAFVRRIFNTTIGQVRNNRKSFEKDFQEIGREIADSGKKKRILHALKKELAHGAYLNQNYVRYSKAAREIMDLGVDLDMDAFGLAMMNGLREQNSAYLRSRGERWRRQSAFLDRLWRLIPWAGQKKRPFVMTFEKLLEYYETTLRYLRRDRYRELIAQEILEQQLSPEELRTITEAEMRERLQILMKQFYRGGAQEPFLARFPGKFLAEITNNSVGPNQRRSIILGYFISKAVYQLRSVRDKESIGKADTEEIAMDARYHWMPILNTLIREKIPGPKQKELRAIRSKLREWIAEVRSRRSELRLNQEILLQKIQTEIFSNPDYVAAHIAEKVYDLLVQYSEANGMAREHLNHVIELIIKGQSSEDSAIQSWVEHLGQFFAELAGLDSRFDFRYLPAASANYTAPETPTKQVTSEDIQADFQRKLSEILLMKNGATGVASAALKKAQQAFGDQIVQQIKAEIDRGQLDWARYFLGQIEAYDGSIQEPFIARIHYYAEFVGKTLSPTQSRLYDKLTGFDGALASLGTKNWSSGEGLREYLSGIQKAESAFDDAMMVVRKIENRAVVGNDSVLQTIAFLIQFGKGSVNTGSFSEFFEEARKLKDGIRGHILSKVTANDNQRANFRNIHDFLAAIFEVYDDLPNKAELLPPLNPQGRFNFDLLFYPRSELRRLNDIVDMQLFRTPEQIRRIHGGGNMGIAPPGTAKQAPVVISTLAIMIRQMIERGISLPFSSDLKGVEVGSIGPGKNGTEILELVAKFQGLGKIHIIDPSREVFDGINREFAPKELIGEKIPEVAGYETTILDPELWIHPQIRGKLGMLYEFNVIQAPDFSPFQIADIEKGIEQMLMPGGLFFALTGGYSNMFRDSKIIRPVPGFPTVYQKRFDSEQSLGLRSELRAEHAAEIDIFEQRQAESLDSANEDIKRAAQILNDVIKDKQRFNALVLRMIQLRSNLSYQEVAKSGETPLEYWQRVSSQLGSLKAKARFSDQIEIIPTTESFKRHILKIEVGPEQFVYFQVKIPGSTRTELSTNDFEFADVGTKAYGKHSKFARPIVMVKGTGTLPAYYNEQTILEFNEDAPFVFMVFEYRDAKRFYYSGDLPVTEPQSKRIRIDEDFLARILHNTRREVNEHNLDELKWQILTDLVRAGTMILDLSIQPYEDQKFRNHESEVFKARHTDLFFSNFSLTLDGEVIIENDFDHSKIVPPGSLNFDRSDALAYFIAPLMLSFGFKKIRGRLPHQFSSVRKYPIRPLLAFLPVNVPREQMTWKEKLFGAYRLASDPIFSTPRAELRQIEKALRGFKKEVINGLRDRSELRLVEEWIIGPEFIPQVSRKLGESASLLGEERLEAGRAEILETLSGVFLGEEKSQADIKNLRITPEAKQFLSALQRYSLAEKSEILGRAGAEIGISFNAQTVTPLILDTSLSSLAGDMQLENYLTQLLEQGRTVGLFYRKANAWDEKLISRFRSKYTGRFFATPVDAGKPVSVNDAFSSVVFENFLAVIADQSPVAADSRTGAILENLVYADPSLREIEEMRGSAGFIDFTLMVLSSETLRRQLDKDVSRRALRMNQAAFGRILQLVERLAQTETARQITSQAA